MNGSGERGNTDGGKNQFQIFSFILQNYFLRFKKPVGKEGV
jgi:hypothetical protein